MRRRPRTAPHRAWSEDEDAKGREMWQDGKPAWVIGLSLNRTRLSVIGRADREGWGPHPNPQGAGMAGKGHEPFKSQETNR